jgi:hypothetical protein
MRPRNFGWLVREQVAGNGRLGCHQQPSWLPGSIAPLVQQTCVVEYAERLGRGGYL